MLRGRWASTNRPERLPAGRSGGCCCLHGQSSSALRSRLAQKPDASREPYRRPATKPPRRARNSSPGREGNGVRPTGYAMLLKPVSREPDQSSTVVGRKNPPRIMPRAESHSAVPSSDFRLLNKSRYIIHGRLSQSWHSRLPGCYLGRRGRRPELAIEAIGKVKLEIGFSEVVQKSRPSPL